MKKLALLSVTLLMAITSYGAGLPTFYAESNTFFNKYVHNGLVAYKSVKANFSEIQSLYDEIGAMNLAKASDKEKQAFYINAYNLVVIYQVAKYYPLKSPLDQSGFFDKVKHQVAGESITLNFLEIKKLLLTYKDPRFHFVLACAAKSCPPLASFAFTPDNLDSKLTERTKKAINDKEWLKVDASNKNVALSKIFEWYQKDFTMNGANSVVDFINKYRTTPIPSSYAVSHYEYNWSLNEER
ncbi:MAG: DUF547 domain-containing protein [Fulvivirga sp.]|uniref:DUF547 domain-containing protein n=1 Tax=Fulvivirga sp. TaxID=1931237 RepID=UPI0032ED7568